MIQDLNSAIERGLAAQWPTNEDRESEHSGHIGGARASIVAGVTPLLEDLQRLREGSHKSGELTASGPAE